jgi:protoheme IX farnesyltransferase
VAIADQDTVARPDARPEIESGASEPRFRLRDYMVLLKLRVMSLVVFTGLTGLVMAPGGVDAATGIAAILCMAIGAGASGAINMWYDRDIDVTMRRTQRRPIPAGRMDAREALYVGLVMAFGSVGAMWFYVNALAAGLLALTILYYVFIYTVWLKRMTPQNIVIGGAAGAFPPLIGWAAVTGDVGVGAWILFAIIFLWTPPHSWALALFRKGDYEAAKVPMMPVAAGVRATKRQVVGYTVLMLMSTALPVVEGMAGWVYGVAAFALGAVFAQKTWVMWRADDDDLMPSRSLFLYSILYLFLVFSALLADRWTAWLFV